MKNIHIRQLINNVIFSHLNNKPYSRIPQLIVILPKHIAILIGDRRVHLSEFVIAKVMGLVVGMVGHPEITRDILEKLPQNLSKPIKIFQDTRADKKYLFINPDPLHEVVVEISRRESGKTEINTIHKVDIDELKRLENKFPTIFSSGENSHVSRIRASP